MCRALIGVTLGLRVESYHEKTTMPQEARRVSIRALNSEIWITLIGLESGVSVESVQAEAAREPPCIEISNAAPKSIRRLWGGIDRVENTRAPDVPVNLQFDSRARRPDADVAVVIDCHLHRTILAPKSPVCGGRLMET